MQRESPAISLSGSQLPRNNAVHKRVLKDAATTGVLFDRLNG